MLTVAAPIAQAPPVAQPQIDALRNANARFEPIPEPQQNPATTRPRADADDYDNARAAVSPRDNTTPQNESLDPRAVSGRNPDDSARGQNPEQRQQQQQQRVEVLALASRDKEVRAHEAAHSTVGGRYAGVPQYSYKRGPDGRSYAVAGEVSIDASPIPGNPEATIRKLQTVQRAALAPADPSAQDIRVAARASAQMARARAEILQARSVVASAGEPTEKSPSTKTASPSFEKAGAIEKKLALPGSTVTLGSDTLYVSCAFCSKPHLQANPMHFAPERLSALALGQKLQSTGAVLSSESVLQRTA